MELLRSKARTGPQAEEESRGIVDRQIGELDLRANEKEKNQKEKNRILLSQTDVFVRDRDRERDIVGCVENALGDVVTVN